MTCARWWPAGLIEVVLRPCGPAGAVGLDVGPARLQLDAATVAVCTLTMPWLPGRPVDDVATLVLGARAAALGPWLAERPDEWHDLDATPEADPDRLAGLARVALARAELARPGRTLVQRLAAHLDAALAARALSLGAAGWAAAGDDDAALAAELAFAVPFDELEELQALTAGRLAGSLKSLADLGVVHLPRAHDLRRLAGRLRRTPAGDEGSAAPADVPAPPVPEPPARPALAAVPVEPRGLDDPTPEVAPEALPGPLAGGPAPVAHRSGPHDVVVRIPRWGERAAGWWARAFRAGTDVPVGAAPLHPAAAGAEAQILAPAAEGPVEIDVVERVAAVRPPRPLAAAWVAQAWGASAARAERLRHEWAASSRWATCAAWHERAGDLARADLALQHARRHTERMAPVPLLGDALEH